MFKYSATPTYTNRRQQTNKPIFIGACDTSDQCYPCADRQHIPPRRHFSLKNASFVGLACSVHPRQHFASTVSPNITYTTRLLYSAPHVKVDQLRILHQHIAPLSLTPY